MPRKKPVKGTPKKKTKKASPKKLTQKISALKAKTKSLDESSIRLKLALEAANMGVWDFDLSTNFVEWSENVHRLFGIPKALFDGTMETFMNLVHPEDRDQVLNAINKSLSARSNFAAEYRIVTPDGTVHWLESIGRIFLDKKGKVTRMMGTVQDVSVKKVIEQEREDWKTRHELISKSAGIVIYDYNIPSGNIKWSGTSEDVLGYAPEELGNIDRWLLLIHPDDRDQALELLEAAEKELRPYDVVYRFQKKSGDYLHLHDRGFFIADHRGKAVRMLGMMNDVSERIQNETLIRENNRFRESIENAIPDILYVHDLKNQRNIYVNKNIYKRFNYTLADIKAMGDNFIEKLVHPEDLAKIHIWTNEPDGFIRETELRIKVRNGQYIWLLARDTPFQRDKQGNVTHIVGIAQDITSRKQFLQQLNSSEQSYRELFDTVSEAIYIAASDGTIVDVNKSACDMFGYDKAEIVSKTPAFLGAEGMNDEKQIDRSMKLALQGEAQSMEFWSKRKNGEIFLQEIKLTRGTYFGNDLIIATGRDITQRIKTEQALRDSEQRFRTLQQASFGGIGLHDKGVIIDCNQGLCDLTGYSYDELIGSNGLLLIAPEWRNFVMEKIQAGYEKTYDVEGIRKDGSRYMLEIQGKNIPYGDTVIRVTEFRNITERKRTEEKILEQNQKLLSLTEDLLRKNDQLEEFTQIVSHNLRSPVGNMVSLLSLFEEATTDQEKTEYLNLLKESTATTLYMLNDLNEVLKIKQNKNIEKQELSFEDALTVVKSMLNARISQLRAEVIYNFEEAPSITYPSIYLESILLNLLDNALKYAHPERTARVEFKTYNDRRGNIVMEVKDNGLGVNLEKYGHQLFKLRKTFHRHPESRGIGLFMVKNQVEAMGGEITMTSKENEGSTFFINFNKTHHDAG